MQARSRGSWNTADPLAGVRGGQVFQAVCWKGSRRVTPENLSDTSLLGAREHGGAIVVDPHHVGQLGFTLIHLRLRPPT